MSNWIQTEYPVAPWDTAGLPPRRLNERCRNHLASIGRGTERTVLCAYRDDDPNRCQYCHRVKKLGCWITCKRNHPYQTPLEGSPLRVSDLPGTSGTPSNEINAERQFAVGDRVRIERDETNYPSRGSWPKFRGRTGTVVAVNTDEYGITFSNAQRVDAWFKEYELR